MPGQISTPMSLVGPVRSHWPPILMTWSASADAAASPSAMATTNPASTHGLALMLPSSGGPPPSHRQHRPPHSTSGRGLTRALSSAAPPNVPPQYENGHRRKYRLTFPHIR